jgi:hypothetical protein
MTNPTTEDTAELKRALEREIKGLTDLEILAPEDIDRIFHTDLWSLSSRELEAVISRSLTLLNETTDVAPKIEAISSHRGLVGAPIVAVKKLLFILLRPFTDTLLADQKTFNGQVVQTQLAQLVLQTRLREELATAAEKLRSLEEDSAILQERLLRLQQSD